MSKKFLAVAAILAVTAGDVAVAAPFQLNFLGQQTLPTGFIPNGPAGTVNGITTPIGGLSGIDYNPVTNSFVAISDDRSDIAPARFYAVNLAYSLAGFTGVTFTGVTTMLRPDGSVFPSSPRQVDPEAIRLTGAANGNLFWSSEGNLPTTQQPFVREMRADGSYVRDFAVPAKFNYVDGTTSGGRGNLLFEALAVTPSGTKLVSANEGAIVQDGPIAGLLNGSRVRLTVYDTGTGQPTAQYGYDVAPIPKNTAPPNQFADNGLVELLAISETEFIAMERSFATGTGNTIKLFLVSFAGATDVLNFDSLASSVYTPVSKTLLLDLDTLGITLDNVEGMSWGYDLANGHRSLVLVSDNNFSATQFTQFLAFDVAPVPAPGALLLLTTALTLLSAARRRQSN
jgi:hypothetical protein